MKESPKSRVRGPGGRAAIALAGALVCSAALGAEDVLHLPIGDPARRDREVPLVIDAITDTAANATLKPSELPARLASTRILFVGEAHVSVGSHAVELAVIRELIRAGRRVSVGLEMFPAHGTRGVLDEWVAGRLSEAEFVERSAWWRHWSYNWNYYREIFLLARDSGVKLFGVNVPAEIVSAVGRKGLEALEAEQKALLPPRVDWDDAELKRLSRAAFGEEEFHGSLSGPMLDRMVQAQATWDAAFGWNAVRAAKEDGDPKGIVVVLLGEGHVFYGRGAERQAKLWFDGKTASLVPVAASNRDKGQCDIRTVRASLADFIWGVPEEDSTLYPSPGFSTRWIQADNLPEVIQVDKKSAAERSGLKVGDRLVEIDGRPSSDRETIHRAFAEKRWGDSVRLSVRRGSETVSLELLLRRERPEPCRPRS